MVGTGPLNGVTVVELAGLGPAPFCGMMLADMGADVICIHRAEPWRRLQSEPRHHVLQRGRRSVGINLKHPDGVDLVLRLAERADVFIEGFRPGVTERMGLGPDDCLRRNPRLIYGRMTGWGQYGPYADAPGHDINYMALSGALSVWGRRGEAPMPPALVGDFGGGGLVLAFGIACALFEARASGEGQVVDASIVDGSSLLVALVYGLSASGSWSPARGTNVVDTGSHFYDVYETADGQYISLGAVEPQFYAELRRLLGLDGPEWDGQLDREKWPSLKKQLSALIRTRTRADWDSMFAGTDVCYAPVLSLREAPAHPHNIARGSFVDVEGVVQPGPAPRFSRTPGAIQRPPTERGADTDEVLSIIGCGEADLDRLRTAGVIY